MPLTLAIFTLLIGVLSLDQNSPTHPPPKQALSGYHWRWDSHRWIEEPNEIVGLTPDQWNLLPCKTDGRFFAIVGDVEGLENSLKFLVDSGATRSYVSDDIWQAWTKGASSENGSTMTMKLGDTLYLNVNVVPADLDNVRGVILGTRIDGILGISELKRAVWKFDYSGKQLSIRLRDYRPLTDLVPSGTKLNLPLQASADGRYSVGFATERASSRAILDTGADGVSVSSSGNQTNYLGTKNVISIKGLRKYSLSLHPNVKTGGGILPWLVLQVRKDQESNVFGTAGLGASEIEVDFAGRRAMVSFADRYKVLSKLLTDIFGLPVKVTDKAIRLDSPPAPLRNYSVKRIGMYSKDQILDLLSAPNAGSLRELTRLGKQIRKGIPAVLNDGKSQIVVTLKSH